MKQRLHLISLFLFIHFYSDAQIYFTNGTNRIIYLAHASFQNGFSKNFISKGWYKIKPGESFQVGGVLNSGYYYYHAQDEEGNEWGSDSRKYLVHPTDGFKIDNADMASTKSRNSALVWKPFNEVNLSLLDNSTVNLTLGKDNCTEGNCTNGKGTFKWLKDCKYYTGDFINGKREGYGIAWYGVAHQYNGCRYEGYWSNDMYNGQGVFKFKDKSRYEGAFKDSKKHGRGILYSASGAVLKSGIWKDDEFVNTVSRPEITWRYPTDQMIVSTSSITTDICVVSVSNIASYEIKVNGVSLSKTRAPEIVENDGCSLKINKSVQLKEGVNTLQIDVLTSDGNQESSIVSFQKTQQKTKSGNTETEKRLALVIGNADYSQSKAGGVLRNPVNDARAMESTLSKLGFTVLKYENLDKTGMLKAIEAFGQKLKNYQLGLFFYAGHGIQINNTNYLVPTDATLEYQTDAEYQCVEAGRVLAKMEGAGSAVNIAILDACRNNPLTRSWNRSVGARGLASMSAPKGSIIAYSAASGQEAPDGTGSNSPYTTELIKALQIPNLTIEDVFKKIRVSLKGQTPAEYSSLTGNVILNKY
ncbi:MAG: caspase family protein [Saprospiraceae bacterium]|nr:caspase family protein [Saprospiraceae bacterium]